MHGTSVQLLDVNLMFNFAKPKGIRKLMRIASGFIFQRVIDVIPVIMGLAQLGLVDS